LFEIAYSFSSRESMFGVTKLWNGVLPESQLVIRFPTYWQHEIMHLGHFSFLILLLTRCISTGVNRTEHGDNEKGIQSFILVTIRGGRNTLEA
jgi:hypothetical protein